MCVSDLAWSGVCFSAHSLNQQLVPRRCAKNKLSQVREDPISNFENRGGPRQSSPLSLYCGPPSPTRWYIHSGARDELTAHVYFVIGVSRLATGFVRRLNVLGFEV